jgi:transposase
MSKTFRAWKIDEPLFLPPTVQDFVAEDHLARFVLSLVRDDLGLAEITGTYGSERGQPPFDPTMMTALLLYSYCCGIYSSRRIAKACRERVDFMSIVALDAPDFRTISDFRKRHLKALSKLFGQILQLCEKAGLVKLGHVALDGTKIKANASKHKAMSYERMEKRAAELEAEVAKWLSTAEAADAEEDKLHGHDQTGEEMPDWVADKKRRAERIRKAKVELEVEAKEAAEAKLRAEAKAEEKREAEGRKKPGRKAAPPSTEPDAKAQKNFTDPDSRIMKSKDGFVQAYNAQAAVDAEAQIIVAHDVTQSAVDCGQLVPMRSRQISAARPSSYRRMPATARRPISKRWRTATSMPMWRPAGPGTPWPARGTARSLPHCSCRRRPTYQRASRPCTPRSEPAATPAPIGCASNCPSRCSGRSNRLAASSVPAARHRERARRVGHRLHRS